MLLRGEMWNTSPCSPISLLAVANVSVRPRLLVISLGRPLCVSALLLWGRIPVSSRSRPLAALCSQTLGPLHSGGARQSTALLRPPGQPLPCGPCSSSGFPRLNHHHRSECITGNWPGRGDSRRGEGRESAAVHWPLRKGLWEHLPTQPSSLFQSPLPSLPLSPGMKRHATVTFPFPFTSFHNGFVKLFKRHAFPAQTLISHPFPSRASLPLPIQVRLQGPSLHTLACISLRCTPSKPTRDEREPRAALQQLWDLR